MLNRRAFVQTLGVGTLGTLTALETSLNAAANPPAAAQQTAARPDMTGLVRIGSNENPYGPAPSALEAVRATATGANRYPGPAIQKLMTAVAEKHGLPDDHVLLSGGSGDLLRAVVTACTSKTRALVAGTPSYESPVRTATALGSPVKAVPLTPELRLDLEKMATQSLGAGVLYICNPNNPTSTSVPAAAVAAAIEKVLASSPSTYVLVDEAYFEYSDLPGFGSATPLVKKYPNVIVVRTFSKIHGMAGMRVGYALAQPKTLEKLRAHHSSSGLSVMSVSAAAASLLDTEHMKSQIALNREVRTMTVDAFEQAGYKVAQSDANFIFVDIKRDARGFQDDCRRNGVAVGRSFPPMSTWARISIGTKEEMQTAIPVFMKVLNAPATQTASIDVVSLEALPSELT